MRRRERSRQRGVATLARVVGASELEPGDVLDTDGNLEQTLVQALGREVKRTADRPGAVCRRDVEADRLLRSAELPQPPR